MKYETYLLLIFGLVGYVAYKEFYSKNSRMGDLGFNWIDPAHVFHKQKRHKRKGSENAVALDDTLTQELESSLTAGTAQTSEAVSGLGYYPLIY